MNSKKTDVAFVGLSHLGLITSIGFSSLGEKILGVDKNKKSISSLQSGKLTLFEPGLEKLFKKTRNKISFTTDFSQLKNKTCIFFTKDTATNGTASIKELTELLNFSIPYFKNGVTIIIISQVPVGFHRNLQNQIKKKRPKLKFYLYHWVDTIIMTKAIQRVLKPERIIIGNENNGKKISKELKKQLEHFACPVFYMSFESAELTKAAINLYLANTVMFADTLSDFCETTGGDIREIIPALQTDKRIGPYSYLKPSLRIAGGHLERDLVMLKRLAKKNGIHSGIVNYITKQNKKRYLWINNTLKNVLKDKKNPIVSLWGLSYKKDTNSTVNAASVQIIKSLKNISINAYDPMAILSKSIEREIKRYKNKYQVLENSDCLIILTDWDEFKKVNIPKLNRLINGKTIIDSVGILWEKKNKFRNITYIPMGGKKIN